MMQRMIGWFWVLVLVGAGAANGDVLARKDVSGENVEGIAMENEFMAIRIIPKGGKISRLVDLRTKRDFVFAGQDGAWGGFCKLRDWDADNAELMTGRWGLTIREATASQAVVEAVCKGRTGGFAGVEFRRIFVIRSGVPYLAVRETATSVERKNAFTPNVHNQFSLESFGSNTAFFYMQSKDGLVRTSVEEGRAHGNNIVYQPASPWIGIVDEKLRSGLVLLAKDEKALGNIYWYVSEKSATMEAAWRRVSLEPKAEVDKWENEYYLIPTVGPTSYYSVSLDAMVSFDRRDKTLMIYSPNGMGDTMVSIYAGDNLLKEQRVTLPAGQGVKIAALPAENQQFPNRMILKSAKKSITVEFKSTMDGQYVFAKPTHTVEKEIEKGVEGFYYYFDAIHISPDITVPIAFGLHGDFSKKSGVRMIIETPNGVELKNGLWKDTPETTPSVREGEGYTKYSFSVPMKNDNFFSQVILFSTTLQTDPKQGLYLYAQWEDGKQTEQRLPLKVDRVERVGKPLRELTVGFGSDPGIIRNWPTFARDYSYCGFNYVELWPYRPPEFLLKRLNKGLYKDLIDSLSVSNIFTSIQLATPFDYFGHVLAKNGSYYKGAGTLFHPAEEYQDVDVEEAKAVDIDGKRLIEMCPTYRGRYFTKAIDVAMTAIDYGFTFLAYDEETWGAGSRICYCERCKKQFAEYLQAKCPKLPYVDPQVFEKNPSEAKALDDAWWNFKMSKVAEIYGAIREAVEKYAGGKIRIEAYVDAGYPHNAKNNRLTDYGRLSAYLDRVLPMSYTGDSRSIGDLVAKTWALIPDKSKVGLAISPARTYEYERVAPKNFPPAEVIKHQILEGFMAGARTILIWAPFSCMNGALSYRHVASAVKMISPVETIITRGSRMNNVESSNKDVFVCGLVYQEEAVILVSEYGLDNVSTVISLKGWQSADVIDLENMVKVAEISEKKPEFKVEISKERLRLFYLKAKKR